MLLEVFTQQQPVIASGHTTLVLAGCVNGGDSQVCDAACHGYSIRAMDIATPLTSETARIVMVALRTQRMKVVALSMSPDAL
eukprot:COSAG02_NODE_3727_length_6315_cov_20.568694_4_plen_82_part_00